jgi:phenylalanyl-tRNA synthetase beta chain
MRVPLSWLAEFTPLRVAPTDRDAVATIAATLSRLGLVVEASEVVGGGLSGVVVARVVEIAPIPGADRIRRVLVEAGEDDPVQVVCGAWNFAVGDLVPLATVGAVLPGEFAIGRRKMKGVTSNGMLCSGAELGLADDAEGILILSGSQAQSSAAESSAIAGVGLSEYLGIETDVVFDVAVELNRPDCLSIIGIARDLAAGLKLPFEVPEPVVVEGATPARRLGSVAVADPVLCGRLTARVISRVAVVPSPPKVMRRLLLSGMRPVNSVVDASNYVMLETGQPTHPYDLDRLGGSGLIARAARDSDTLQTLDGITHTFSRTGSIPAMAPGQSQRPEGSSEVGSLRRGIGPAWPEGAECLICDANDVPVGLAGVLGGSASEITEETTRVLLEVATFDRAAIAAVAARRGLRTEASVRFERGVDEGGLERAGSAVCALIVAAATAAGFAPPEVAAGLLDSGPARPPARAVVLRPEAVNSLLGTELSAAEIVDYLAPIGFSATDEPAGLAGGAEDSASQSGEGPPTSGGTGTALDGRSGPGAAGSRLRVRIPSWRSDVTAEVDLIEEVARLHGYESIKKTSRRSPAVGVRTALQQTRRDIRRLLTGCGATEAWTRSAIDPRHLDLFAPGAEPVRLANPMTREESVLRPSLLPGLLEALASNAARRNPDIRLFEIGHVFSRAAEGGPPLEEESVAVVFGHEDDDVRAAVAAWRVVADGLSIRDVAIVASTVAGLCRGRTGLLTREETPVVLGLVGEVDAASARAFSLAGRRIGVLVLSPAGLLAARGARPRLGPISRFPSADVDLAFVLADAVPAATLEHVIVTGAGELCESVRLFDVYRGPGVDRGSRGLAYRLRFCAPDRTLSGEELADLRQSVIAAVEGSLPARLRS